MGTTQMQRQSVVILKLNVGFVHAQIDFIVIDMLFRCKRVKKTRNNYETVGKEYGNFFESLAC